MNWKPAVIGGVVVMIAGLVVGITIGGKKVTKTVTKVKTETVVQEPTTQPTQTQTEAEPKPGGTSSEDDEFLTDLSEPKTENLDIELKSAKIGRKTYSSSIVVDPFGSWNQDEGAILEYPVDEGFNNFRAAFGFAPDASSKARLKLEIHKNTKRGDVLYKRNFKDPSDIDPDVNFSLKDAIKVVFVWATDPEDDYEYPDAPFVLGNARFTKTSK